MSLSHSVSLSLSLSLSSSLLTTFFLFPTNRISPSLFFCCSLSLFRPPTSPLSPGHSVGSSWADMEKVEPRRDHSISSVLHRLDQGNVALQEQTDTEMCTYSSQRTDKQGESVWAELTCNGFCPWPLSLVVNTLTEQYANGM